jgi:hypothetical protein
MSTDEKDAPGEGTPADEEGWKALVGGWFARAPAQEEWDAMGPEERERVVASLPGREMLLESADEVVTRLAKMAAGLQRRATRAERRVAELQAELERLERERR